MDDIQTAINEAVKNGRLDILIDFLENIKISVLEIHKRVIMLQKEVILNVSSIFTKMVAISLPIHVLMLH